MVLFKADCVVSWAKKTSLELSRLVPMQMARFCHFQQIPRSATCDTPSRLPLLNFLLILCYFV